MLNRRNLFKLAFGAAAALAVKPLAALAPSGSPNGCPEIRKLPDYSAASVFDAQLINIRPEMSYSKSRPSASITACMELVSPSCSFVWAEPDRHLGGYERLAIRGGDDVKSAAELWLRTRDPFDFEAIPGMYILRDHRKLAAAIPVDKAEREAYFRNAGEASLHEFEEGSGSVPRLSHVESFLFNRDEIARIFQVLPHLLDRKETRTW